MNALLSMLPIFRRGNRRSGPHITSRMERPAFEHEQPVTTAVTISRDDDRFPTMTEAVDGVAIKIKHTDPDPDADIEVYKNGERILQLKDWCAGERAFVEGRSGKRYELRLLDINDETETIRVEIAECE